MSPVLIGPQIIGAILKEGTTRPFVDQGWDLSWVSDQAHPEHAALFRGSEGEVYAHILKHEGRHGVVPTLDLLEYEFSTVNLPAKQLTVSEIIEIANRQLGRLRLTWHSDDIKQLREEGHVEEAAELMLASAQKVLRSAQRAGEREVWDRADFDIEAFANRTIPAGPGFGVPELDEHWPGAQPGYLVTLLGRAKANKTTFALASAYHAWAGSTSMGGRRNVDPRRVLFVTHEINIDGINARLMCYGAGVNPERFMMPTSDAPPSPQDQAKLIRFWEREITPHDSQAFQVVQPGGRYTISDLEMDIDAFEADIVYIDGFYFMVDEQTGQAGGDWRGHDNLARDLKSLALRKQVPVFVTHQMREKQLGKSGGGISADSSMMAGTGLRMASDVVLTLDKDLETQIVTITCTASRLSYLPTVKGEWLWDDFRFNAMVDEGWESEADES